MENVTGVGMLEDKAERLRQILTGHARLIVAYSGGVDSAFLAWTAHQVLGDQMLAVIADSASLARTHLEEALAFAASAAHSASGRGDAGTGKSGIHPQRLHALLSL
jgi:GMP synthase PP-ATPase subunit